MAEQPNTQQTYSDSDLAPIGELLDTARKRGFWSKAAGAVSNTVNFLGDATEFVTGVPVGRIRASMGF
jgi:hypothetical protein